MCSRGEGICTTVVRPSQVGGSGGALPCEETRMNADRSSFGLAPSREGRIGGRCASSGRGEVGGQEGRGGDGCGAVGRAGSRTRGRAGVSVLGARDGAEGLAAAAKDPLLALLVLDVNMPVMNGL